MFHVTHLNHVPDLMYIQQYIIQVINNIRIKNTDTINIGIKNKTNQIRVHSNH